MLVVIYSPSKFVFIHIPRTGGMAITQALARRLPEIADMTINVSGIGDQPSGWWRHSRACELARDIPHWDSLYKFAVMRNPWEIVASFWRLVQRDLVLLKRPVPEFPKSARDYWAFLSQSAGMTFEEWVRWHFRYLEGSGGFWRYWCYGEQGDDLGVEPIRYARLAEEWPRVCGRLNIGVLELVWVNATCLSVDWTLGAVEFVRELCREDIARFGHGFGQPARLAPEERRHLAEKAREIDPETPKQISVLDPEELAALIDGTDSAENQSSPTLQPVAARQF